MAEDYVGVYRSLLKSSKSVGAEVRDTRHRLGNGNDAIILRRPFA
jgi:hypothetical protein